MNEPMVSIYVPVFNHENYIVQALDSILMQQTEYAYEAFVGEDCSTDNTRRVIKEWEAAHPDARFTFFYRESNMHKAEITNAMDLKLRCKGKYMICLEGDDFWTDPLKLQKQVSFLESHPEYYAVAHNCTVVGADSQPNGETYPECKDTEYTFRHYIHSILPGQAATFLYRNYMLDKGFDRSLFMKPAGPADRNLYFAVRVHGRIYCMQETMSAYRHITSGGSSFSATFRYSYDTEELAARRRLEFAYQTGNQEAVRCTELLYLKNIRGAIVHRRIGLGRAWKELQNIRHKWAAAFRLLKFDFNTKLLRRRG